MLFSTFDNTCEGLIPWSRISGSDDLWKFELWEIVQVPRKEAGADWSNELPGLVCIGWANDMPVG